MSHQISRHISIPIPLPFVQTVRMFSSPSPPPSPSPSLSFVHSFQWNLLKDLLSLQQHKQRESNDQNANENQSQSQIMDTHRPIPFPFVSPCSSSSSSPSSYLRYLEYLSPLPLPLVLPSLFPLLSLPLSSIPVPSLFSTLTFFSSFPLTPTIRIKFELINSEHFRYQKFEIFLLKLSQILINHSITSQSTVINIYLSTISALCSFGFSVSALRMFEEFHQRGGIPTSEILNKLILSVSLSPSMGFEVIKQIFLNFKIFNLPVGEEEYKNVITAAGRKGEAFFCISLYNEAKEKGVMGEGKGKGNISVPIMEAMISALSKVDNFVSQSFDFYGILLSNGVIPSLLVFRSLLGATARGGDVRVGMEIWHQMCSLNIPKGEKEYVLMMKTIGNSQRKLLIPPTGKEISHPQILNEKGKGKGNTKDNSHPLAFSLPISSSIPLTQSHRFALSDSLFHQYLSSSLPLTDSILSAHIFCYANSLRLVTTMEKFNSLCAQFHMGNRPTMGMFANIIKMFVKAKRHNEANAWCKEMMDTYCGGKNYMENQSSELLSEAETLSNSHSISLFPSPSSLSPFDSDSPISLSQSPSFSPSLSPSTIPSLLTYISWTLREFRRLLLPSACCKLLLTIKRHENSIHKGISTEYFWKFSLFVEEIRLWTKEFREIEIHKIQNQKDNSESQKETNSMEISVESLNSLSQSVFASFVIPQSSPSLSLSPSALSLSSSSLTPSPLSSSSDDFHVNDHPYDDVSDSSISTVSYRGTSEFDPIKFIPKESPQVTKEKELMAMMGKREKKKKKVY